MGNLWLIKQQMPQATRCAGFNAWKKLGCTVKEGSKALWVVAPWTRKVTDPDTGEVFQAIVGWLSVPTFDVSQVEGAENLPSYFHPLEGDWDTLLALGITSLGKQGILVNMEDLPANTHGISYGGRIGLNRNASDSDKFLCLLHEAAHEVLHKGKDGEGINRRQRELEAESTSYVLAKHFGLHNPFSADYILSFRGSVEGLHQSTTRIHLAVKRVMEWFDVSKVREVVDNNIAA
jgi:hypothetical protein